MRIRRLAGDDGYCAGSHEISVALLITSLYRTIDKYLKLSNQVLPFHPGAPHIPLPSSHQLFRRRHPRQEIE